MVITHTHPLRRAWRLSCGDCHRSTPPANFPELTREYGYAILSEEAVSALIALEKVIELGAGNGYNAQLISKTAATQGHELDYRAFDISTEYWTKRHFDVEIGSTEVLKQFSSHALFLCWPNGDHSFAFEAAKAYRELGGEKLAFVGEPETVIVEENIDYDDEKPGRMGNAEFHQELREFWTADKQVPVHRWPGFHDRLVIYSRKES